MFFNKIRRSARLAGKLKKYFPNANVTCGQDYVWVYFSVNGKAIKVCYGRGFSDDVIAEDMKRRFLKGEDDEN